MAKVSRYFEYVAAVNQMTYLTEVFSYLYERKFYESSSTKN